jgi:tetratricopeptide (TPR) repeat protein
MYSFLDLTSGTYTLQADTGSAGEAAFGPFVLSLGESKQIDLKLSAKPGSSSEQPAFFDEPQFTVAGVTETTNLGGHGSNATSRTKAELTKDIAALSGEPASGRDSASALLSGATENALRAEADRHPDDFSANYRVGKALAANGKTQEALAYLARAAKLNPNDFNNTYALAIAYAQTGQLEQARATALTLLRTQEKDRREGADIHHLLGNVEEKLGNPLEAVRQYQRAAELDPSESNLFDWGAELLLHHAPEPAGDVLTKGNHFFPHSARMLIGLGISWYVRGSYDNAVERLGQASDLAPDDPVPHMFLGRLRTVDTGRSEIYVEKLGRFAQRQPDNAWAHYYYALSLLKQRTGPEDTKSLPLIESLLEKAVRLDPWLAAGYLQIGAIYAERDDLAKAIPAYQKAANADPTLEEAHYRLAQAYRRTGDTAKAQAELQLYNQLSKEAAAKEEKQRREIQQFVYSVQGRSTNPPPK